MNDCKRDYDIVTEIWKGRCYDSKRNFLSMIIKKEIAFLF